MFTNRVQCSSELDGPQVSTKIRFEDKQLWHKIFYGKSLKSCRYSKLYLRLLYFNLNSNISNHIDDIWYLSKYTKEKMHIAVLVVSAYNLKVSNQKINYTLYWTVHCSEYFTNVNLD